MNRIVPPLKKKTRVCTWQKIFQVFFFLLKCIEPDLLLSCERLAKIHLQLSLKFLDMDLTFQENPDRIKIIQWKFYNFYWISLFINFNQILNHWVQITHNYFNFPSVNLIYFQGIKEKTQTLLSSLVALNFMWTISPPSFTSSDLIYKQTHAGKR